MNKICRDCVYAYYDLFTTSSIKICDCDGCQNGSYFVPSIIVTSLVQRSDWLHDPYISKQLENSIKDAKKMFKMIDDLSGMRFMDKYSQLFNELNAVQDYAHDVSENEEPKWLKED